MTTPAADVPAFPPLSKAELRRAALSARDALTPETRAAAAEVVAATEALPLLPAGTVVAGYFPIRSELDPRPLMRRLVALGALPALPAVGADGETLTFRLWREGDALVAAAFGLSEPPADAPAVDPDVLLMPLAAFDAKGDRIGYGKGHYDRALERLEREKPRLKVGLAFSCQRVDRVPAEPHDRPLDLVLTEAGAIVPGAPDPE
ncbi:MAG: 5-formyltetrahydrofolate cyclo-ligase [Phyllobacteriaceae bacterium]|nr:5-formyltetrahydrofolate cyclo-ligase [Phyllobacteriaceae bacterium]